MVKTLVTTQNILKKGFNIGIESPLTN